MGWVPMDEETWPHLVAALQRIGEPWPEECCLFDLRWLYDQNGVLPGRRALAKRWNVTDRVARRLLASGQWWDKSKGVPPTSRERPSDVPRASRERPAPARMNADNGREMSRERPSDVPVVSRERPADVHTRVDPHSHSHSHSQEEPVSESADVGRGTGRQKALWEEWERCAEMWHAHNGNKGPKLSRTKGQGLAMKARASDHGEGAITKVLQWALTSRHDRAVFLRERGLSLQTLMRASNFETYLGFAAQGEPALRGQYTPTTKEVDVATEEDKRAARELAEMVRANGGGLF